MGEYIFRLGKKSTAFELFMNDHNHVTCGTLVFAFKPHHGMLDHDRNDGLQDRAESNVRRTWKNNPHPMFVIDAEKPKTAARVIHWNTTLHTVSDYDGLYDNPERTVGYLVRKYEGGWLIGTHDEAQAELARQCAKRGSHKYSGFVHTEKGHVNCDHCGHRRLATTAERDRFLPRNANGHVQSCVCTGCVWTKKNPGKSFTVVDFMDIETLEAEAGN